MQAKQLFKGMQQITQEIHSYIMLLNKRIEWALKHKIYRISYASVVNNMFDLKLLRYALNPLI